MGIPLVYFFILYLIVIGIFIIGSVFVVYHALRFGQASTLNKTTMTLYIVISVLLIGLSFLSLSLVDWSQRVDISGAAVFFFL